MSGPDPRTPIYGATANAAKLAWFARAFPAEHFVVQASVDINVAEPDNTCEQNVLRKVLAHRTALTDKGPKAIIVAEDSGLFVGALGGFPAAHAADFAPGTDDDRAALLRQRVAHSPSEDQTIWFQSTVAVSCCASHTLLFSGRLNGTLINGLIAPGTGYDSIFAIDGTALTDIDPNTLDDHRDQALRLAAQGLQAQHPELWA